MQPLYQQVEHTLKEMIDGIEFEPGDQIPSERELAEELHISRMTIRRAIESLIRQGKLERRSTSGTFVSEPNVIRQLTPGFVQSLSRQIQEKGGRAGSKLLMFEITRAPIKVAEYLNVRLGSQVFLVKRLRLTNKLPFCIETSYLPAGLFIGMTAEDITGHDSLYDYFHQTFNIIPNRSEDQLKIAYATEEEATLLGLQLGGPVFYFRSIVFTDSGSPFEFVKSINHPDKVVFTSSTSLTTNPNLNMESL